MSETWLSAHLFWPGSLDDLLRKYVTPLVAHCFRQQLATGFFFIRYAEGGPHVRLRLKASLAAHSTLAICMEQRFTRFLRSQDRDRAGRPAVAAAEARVQFMPYEPEMARYGGPPGLPIAEVFFEASSRAALSWLRTQASEADSQRLPTALALHTVFAAACLCRPPLAIDWLRRYTDDWLPHDPQAGPAQRAHWLALFAERYEWHRPALTALVARHWQPIAASRVLPRWLTGFAAAAHQAAECYQQAVADPVQRQVIYASLLHMTNNRLGVPNHDEAFVAYLLGKSLQQLTSEQ